MWLHARSGMLLWKMHAKGSIREVKMRIAVGEASKVVKEPRTVSREMGNKKERWIKVWSKQWFLWWQVVRELTYTQHRRYSAGNQKIWHPPKQGKIGKARCGSVRLQRARWNHPGEKEDIQNGYLGRGSGKKNTSKQPGKVRQSCIFMKVADCLE